jgi:hypothetical protein
VSSAKAQSVGTTVAKTIKEATKQGKNVIIDARNQRGLTEANARRPMENAVRELPIIPHQRACRKGLEEIFYGRIDLGRDRRSVRFWVLGFAVHIGGGLIHILLVIALVLLVFNVLTGRGARI